MGDVINLHNDDEEPELYIKVGVFRAEIAHTVSELTRMSLAPAFYAEEIAETCEILAANARRLQQHSAHSEFIDSLQDVEADQLWFEYCYEYMNEDELDEIIKLKNGDFDE